MKIQIGIRDVQVNLEIDVDIEAAALADKVNLALKDDSPLTLTDTDGQLVIVPAAALGFIRTSPNESRRVGFGFARV